MLFRSNVGDNTDWAHYSAESMDQLGSLFASCVHFMMITDLNVGPVEHKITYITDGGSVDGGSTQYAYAGEKITLPSATKDGYIFLSWTDGTNTYAAGDEYTITSSDVTFTAQWEAIQYTITCPNSTNSITTTVDKTTATSGETVTITFKNTAWLSSKTVYVTVTDKNGNTLLPRTQIKLNANATTTKTFTVKNSDVTITVSQN